MADAHFNFNSLGWICVNAMTSGLFDQFSPMNKYEGLIYPIVGRRYTIDQLSENYLWFHKPGIVTRKFVLTVLPLPVARLTPNRLWPFSKWESTD